jgi:predicted O-methyltransferase YrrM
MQVALSKLSVPTWQARAHVLSSLVSDAWRISRAEGVCFTKFFLTVQNSVPGWLDESGARLLHSLARGGPGAGVIVEIGSAWGRSTLYLARGSEIGGRGEVYSIDPHTGDPAYLDGLAGAWYPRRILGKYSPWVFGDPLQFNPDLPGRFTSYDLFVTNLRRFGLSNQVVPMVMKSVAASQQWKFGPIRLLFVDGLHTYEGVCADIQAWVPKVVSGGIIVFDDYFNEVTGHGVRRAVDELLASGWVEPVLRRPNDPSPSQLVWTRKC